MSLRLVVLDASFGEVSVEAGAAAPYGVAVEDGGGVRGQEIPAVAADADGVLVQYGRIDDAVMAECPGWRVIGRYGVGVDNVDVPAASRRGIAVVNVPDYCVEEVATHTAALALAGLRKIGRSQALIADDRWGDWSELRPVQRLSGLTLGLVGVGRIGAEVARLLGPFFGRVIAYDLVTPSSSAIEMVGLDEVFGEADLISLHCPLNDETAGLVNAPRLATMKDSAYLVNVSRGGLIDLGALIAALHEGSLAGAALDVLPVEPPDRDDALHLTQNLLVTNHVAWYSETALIAVRQLLAERCSAYLTGSPVPTVVNANDLQGGGR
jgi:D-3-phosphoglycerate dehydrogenase